LLADKQLFFQPQKHYSPPVNTNDFKLVFCASQRLIMVCTSRCALPARNNLLQLTDKVAIFFFIIKAQITCGEH
jgi:hypothetical protein